MIGSDEEKLEEARHEVLVENTAQAVHKHLSKLLQEEARFRNRWVWELLQNARDAAPTEGSVWLIQEPRRVVFRHNGIPFTHKSIAHLIYHGSTKYGSSESDDIGQFGTGFLTTHLISKTVTVKGTIADGRHFCFLLDRRGNNADELKQAMDESWEAFVHSLTQVSSDTTQSFTTEYTYPLETNIVPVVTEGIVDLITNAAYLLAFNGRIASLAVQQPDRSVVLRRKSSNAICKMAQRVHIEECAAGNGLLSRYVVAFGRDETTVAVEVAEVDDICSVSDMGKSPRIFVAFPLTGTRDFCLPVVINNEKFHPREDRDTLVLLPNRDGKHPNMVRMEQACDLSVQLAVLAAEGSWSGAATLLRLNPLGTWDWVDSHWLRELLAERFVGPLREAMVMTTAAGDGHRIAPASSIIPLSAGPTFCLALWDIAAQINGALEKLPRRNEAHLWSDILEGWASFLSTPVGDLVESLTLEKLCSDVAAWGTMTDLAKQLEGSVDPIAWLNQLHALIRDVDQIGLFERLRLIPSQSGKLKKISELRRDPGIDEKLKDIAESLGLPIRDGLLDQRMRLQELLDLPLKPLDEVVTAAVQKLKDKAKLVDGTFGPIAVDLFAWLVRHNETDRLDGFPVLTRATTERDPALTVLFRDPAKADERPLAPLGSWPEAARKVADLFPKRQTLSDDYSKALPENADWTRVAEEGYVRLSPLYRTHRRGVPFIPDEPISLSEKNRKVKHRTKDAVEVSALAFFEKDDIGLDAVRSRMRAIALLAYLADHVLTLHTDALDAVEADCECGEKHRYFSSAWLVPMWDRQWVPSSDGKRFSATAESIAQLFDGKDEELRRLTTGMGRRLLEALNISLADLSLRAIAKDETTRITLIDSFADIVRAANNDAAKVKLLAEEIKHSPGLFDEIRENSERRRRVKRNQSLGAAVEKALEEALQDHGLRVTRTGVGSDYEVEEDYIVDDKEVALSIDDGHRSFLVEIKATSSKVARMTVTQAQTAVSNKDRFILCVVPVDSREVTPEIVRERCRFAVDIGHHIEPVWDEYQNYQESKGKACTRVGDVELIVYEGGVRFAVSQQEWAGGLSLQDAVQRILSTRRQEDGT